MKIYTMEYQPFVMGGSVWQPIACEIDDYKGPYDLGGGYKGFLIIAPNGATFVAEAKTGALVGPSIQDVRKDIETGDPDIMKEQVNKAALDCMRARMVSPDEFWRKLKANV